MKCPKRKECEKIKFIRIKNFRQELKYIQGFINTKRDDPKWKEYHKKAVKTEKELNDILDCIEVMLGKSLLSIVTRGEGGCSATHVLRSPGVGQDLEQESPEDEQSKKEDDEFKELLKEIKIPKIGNARQELRTIRSFINAERDNQRWEEYQGHAVTAEKELNHILDCLEVILGKFLLSVVKLGYGGCSGTHILRPPLGG